MLDNNMYTLMKYQHCKLIDIVDNNNNIRNAKHTDLDSNVNNHASLDDVKDYLSVPNLDTLRDTGTSSNHKSKGKKEKHSHKTPHHPTPSGPESEL